MFRRFADSPIRNVLGTGPFLKTFLMLLGSTGFSLFEYLQFGTCYSGLSFLALAVLGWLFRKRVMEFGVD